MKKYFILLPAIIFLFSCTNGNDKGKKETVDSAAEKKLEQAMTPQEREMREMKEMAEKQKQKPQENPYKDAKIEVKVFDNSKKQSEQKLTGFGYEIYMYDALYITQPNIPAINGNRGFTTKEQAQKVGDLVAYKIHNNIMPPSVTPKELDSLGALK